MRVPTKVERRQSTRGERMEARRRYPRLRVNVDAYYESEGRECCAESVELSLRGVFFPTHTPEALGTEAVVRLGLPGNVMFRARAIVVRHQKVGSCHGVGLQFAHMSEPDRARLAAFLLKQGGLAVLPQLERQFGGWARLVQPGLLREKRAMRLR
jgi:hypothetical protein